MGGTLWYAQGSEGILHRGADRLTGGGDMCITFHASELSNTKLYAGEARRGDTYVHVIAYQNKAATKGPNAMILPLPAAVMPGPENVVDTRGFELFLDDIHSATEIADPHGER